MPRDGASFLWKNCGGRALATSHFLAAKKPAVAATKICAEGVAFSLPQDSKAELMFEPCETRASCASASPRLDFPALAAVATSGVARQQTVTASIA
jgi:hypothetical protein